MEKNVTTKMLYLAMKRAYWYGFATYLGINMLIQDWLGLEGYIAFVRTHWAEIHWVVGLLIAATGMYSQLGLLGRFHWLNKEKEDGTRNNAK